MDSTAKEHARQGRLVGTFAICMITAGFFCTPAGVFALTFGHKTFVSFGVKVFAWATGCGLAAVGLFLFARRRQVAMLDIVLAGAACIVSAVLTEGLLALVGFQPSCHLVFRVPPLVPWWICDETVGNRFIPDQGWRGFSLNRDGFGDSDEFTTDSAEGAKVRVLLLGDSFTFGVNASSREESWAGRLEQFLQAGRSAVVWNTGIPGIGGMQQLRSLQTYFPVLQPQLVVLGFCLNDFIDNQYPMGVHYVFEPCLYVFRYTRGPKGRVLTLSPEEAYRRAFNVPKRWPDYLCLTRVGSLAASAMQGVDRWHKGSGKAAPKTGCDLPGYVETRDLLGEIARYVVSHDARLLVLPIPYAKSLKTPSPRYETAVALFRELGVDFVEVRSVLCEDDYDPIPDGHWNDSGHAKVAEVVNARVDEILRESGL